MKNVRATQRLRPIAFRLLALSTGLIMGLLMVEIGLRIYHPFELRIRGRQLNLPCGVRYEFDNRLGGRLDHHVVNTRNRLGFRGPAPPDDLRSHLTIIAVGGSTTECLFLSDGDSWPEKLAVLLDESYRDVWVNNAGLSGHSTQGHIALLDQYLCQLKPRVVLFLFGINDVERRDLVETNLGEFTSGSRLNDILGQYSHVWALADNLRRHRMAFERMPIQHMDLTYTGDGEIFNGDRVLDLSDAARAEVMQEHRRKYIPGFRKRVRYLVRRCRQCDIVPVLITQPILYGPVIDDRTGVDLGRIKIFSTDSNGLLQWEVLELYNAVTREIGQQLDVLVIDLAHSLPKSTRYFYDECHFTIAGAHHVAALIERELTPFLRSRFPEFVRSPKNNTPP